MKDCVRLSVTEDTKDLVDLTIGRKNTGLQLYECYRLFEDSPTSSVVKLVTAKDLQHWNVPPATVHKAAIENTARAAVLLPVAAFPPVALAFHNDAAFLDGAYLLTTEASMGLFGAGAVLLPRDINPFSNLPTPMMLLPMNRDYRYCVPEGQVPVDVLASVQLQVNVANFTQGNLDQIWSAGVFRYDKRYNQPLHRVK